MIVLVAFALRARTAGTFQVIDELQWMRRSEGFSNALLNADPGSASASSVPGPLGIDRRTMPGVPTMWIGSAARGLWTVAKDVGLAEDSGTFTTNAAALRMAQTGVALATALLVGVLTWLVQRWVGLRAAVLTGIFVATEPFLVAHGAVLHTDELQGLFASAGAIALALALGVPRPVAGSVHRRSMAALAGALCVGAPLTKLSGVAIAPGLAVLVVWAAASAWRRTRHGAPEARSVRAVMGPVVGTCAVAAGAALAVALVAWPALWADPSTQVEELRKSADIGFGASRSFFMGRVVTDGSPWFYAVAVPLRTTPWLLVTALVGVPVALVRRTTRLHAVALAAVAGPVLINLSTVPKQFDRYALTVLILVIVVASAGLLTDTRLAPRWARAILATVGVVATAHSWMVAPWGLAYFNPILGGGPAAMERVPIEWQEGHGQVSERLAEIAGEDCRDITVAGINPWLQGANQCGMPVKEDPTHLVLYVTSTQKMTDAEIDAATEGRVLVGRVVIRDVEYATIWARPETG